MNNKKTIRYNHAPMMPFAPGNRIYTAFLMRLMYVFPAICPRKVETGLISFLEKGLIDKG